MVVARLELAAAARCVALTFAIAALAIAAPAVAQEPDDEAPEPTEVSAADESDESDDAANHDAADAPRTDDAADAASPEETRAALQLCTAFATAVVDHQDDCVAMGTGLVALVDDNWKPLHRLARRVGPDSALQERCLDEVEPAVVPLMACLDDDGVASAMRRLRTLRHEVAR